MLNDIKLDCNYVTIEVKTIRTSESGKLYEVSEKKKVPDFVAEILTGKPVSRDDRSASDVK